jgi:hypothetical protein
MQKVCGFSLNKFNFFNGWIFNVTLNAPLRVRAGVGAREVLGRELPAGSALRGWEGAGENLGMDIMADAAPEENVRE